MIQYLGLGRVEAHHAWFGGAVTFGADKKMHLVENVITLSDKLEVPPEPPLELPRPPDVKEMETTSDLAVDHNIVNTGCFKRFESSSKIYIDKREANSEGIRWADQ